MENKEDKENRTQDSEQKAGDKKAQDKWYFNPDEWDPKEAEQSDRMLFDEFDDIASNVTGEVKRLSPLFKKTPLFVIILSAISLVVIIYAFVNEARIKREADADENKLSITKSTLQNELDELDWVLQDLLPVNQYSRPAIELAGIRGIVIHNIGNPDTTAKQNRDYFASLAETEERHASSHFIVCLDGSIIQCIPIDEVAYASNQRNADTLSIEVCHPDETGRFTDETYATVVRLTAWLLANYDLTSEALLRHYDIQGKECPRYFVENPDAWETFKSNVTREMDR